MIEIWMEADRYWFFLVVIGFFLGRWYCGKKHQETADFFKKTLESLKDYQKALDTQRDQVTAGIKDLQELNSDLLTSVEKPRG